MREPEPFRGTRVYNFQWETHREEKLLSKE